MDSQTNPRRVGFGMFNCKNTAPQASCCSKLLKVVQLAMETLKRWTA